ncbi:Ribosomal protein L37 mitochondrial [Trinorchestia longiramus]|nr:Ribosomal protein L37 mitochondrial [Trinorchestia longiramus]
MSCVRLMRCLAKPNFIFSSIHRNFSGTPSLFIGRDGLPVETDPHKLRAYVCGSDMVKENRQDVKVKEDHEYPDWLWELRTGLPPPLEELDPNTKYYWRRLRNELFRTHPRVTCLTSPHPRVTCLTSPHPRVICLTSPHPRVTCLTSPHRGRCSEVLVCGQHNHCTTPVNNTTTVQHLSTTQPLHSSSGVLRVVAAVTCVSNRDYVKCKASSYTDTLEASSTLTCASQHSAHCTGDGNAVFKGVKAARRCQTGLYLNSSVGRSVHYFRAKAVQDALTLNLNPQQTPTCTDDDRHSIKFIYTEHHHWVMVVQHQTFSLLVVGGSGSAPQQRCKAPQQRCRAPQQRCRHV